MTLHHARHALLVLILAVSSLLAACGNGSQADRGPVTITADSYCSLDGMALADYPGPKAQIHYAQGEPDLFCDTVEMFSIYLQPERQRPIVAMYVHDMARNDWDHPTGDWIDARTAYYVAGSRRRGSMGPTFASFARQSDAAAFAAREGGKVLAFDEITPEQVILDGGVLKDRAM
ncbi:NosL [Steroidobacter denitrificans]|uniref:NosL n=1 Tax=Steroidobacter denitrificans TaxID=465721 RepID=A0A127FBI8_STEDE|nr:nitrous oxide reductase accessory protein NosL [Steroidobacter denitrificans]AMN47783.1 NosL [Steroidobacter denitrificans]